MANHDELNFAGLRQLRAGARLTQEELAEAAGISPRSVSDLERGVNRTARKDTALSLANALGLRDSVRTVFVLAARGRAAAREVLAAEDETTSAGAFGAAATRTLPRDVAAFTGRDAEIETLMKAAAGPVARGEAVGIHAIGGMPGVGKTVASRSCSRGLQHRGGTTPRARAPGPVWPCLPRRPR